MSGGISEEKRVQFTKQLRELRDSNLEQLAFPASLSPDDRKFIHKIAQEFGLKSKSQGGGDNRFITVLKKKSNVQKASGLAPVLWAPHQSTVQALSDPAFAAANQPLARKASFRTKKTAGGGGPAVPARNYEIPIEHYHAAQHARQSNKNYSGIQKKRNQLPAAHYRTAVCNLLKENQIVLISGETGCGKSTQVPQFLLDDPAVGPGCRIAITQPRRISAVSVAERIAAERSEAIGTTVGYNIRLDSARSASTQVTFMTPGVLLRKLLTDPLLLEYTHVLVDEAHERDRFTEFLQIILRDICTRRADLKLILMSATMHTDKIRAYFGDIPQINVGGSVFPVQEYFLEHALRFTHFASAAGHRATLPTGEEDDEENGAPVAKHSKASKKGAAGPATVAMSSRLSVAAPVYHCALCGGGPFHSPEELGTHSAECYGPGPGRAKGAALPLPQAANRALSRLDALAASISALRLGSAAAGKAAPTVSSQKPFAEPTAAMEQDGADGQPEAGTRNSGEGGEAGEASQEEDGDVDLSLSVDVEGSAEMRRARSNSEDETTLNAVLLAQYQSQWDDTQVDCDLIYALLKYVFSSAFGQQGSVLVFLPGWDDISRLHRQLASSPEFSNPHKFMLLQLHSGIQKKDQDMVFHSLRPGQHKIILSTNIAETSITIDDVTVVIDTGRVKEKTYDPHTKLAYLQSSWISQASARQRRGRAGRTQAGVCFHLYSTLRAAHLSEFQDSELLRMPLEELVLQAKNLGVAPGEGSADDSVTAFLLKAMDPPHLLSIRNAISLLQAISCLDEHEQVTPIGAVVSQLPLNPRMGRMILLGCLLGCGPSAVATAAAMGYRDPFIMPATEHQRALCNRAKARIGGDVTSDQVVVLRALGAFTATLKRAGLAQARHYCDENFLSLPTMQYLDELVQQLQQLMREAGIQVNQARLLRNEGNHALVQAVVSLGLYPDVGVRKNGAKIFSTERGCKAKIHPSSINARLPLYRKECAKPIESVGFQDLIASTQGPGGGHYIGGANLLMLCTTPVSPLALLLACGRLEEVSTGEENEDLQSEQHVEVELDGWLSLQMHRDHLALVEGARQLLSVALTELLQGGGKQQDKTLLRAVDRLAEVLSSEQRACCMMR